MNDEGEVGAGMVIAAAIMFVVLGVWLFVAAYHNITNPVHKCPEKIQSGEWDRRECL